ncbi:MAG: protease, partial [Actinomycetota bacterium]
MYSAIAANKRNTIFIMLVFLVIIGGLGWFAAYMYGDINIAIFTVVIAAAYAFFQYYLASSQALSMAGAIEIQKADNPR